MAQSALYKDVLYEKGARTGAEKFAFKAARLWVSQMLWEESFPPKSVFLKKRGGRGAFFRKRKNAPRGNVKNSVQTGANVLK